MEDPPSLTYIKHSIRFLSFERNDITFVFDQYFEGRIMLEQIKLSNNKITVIPSLRYVSQTLIMISLNKNNIADGRRLYEGYFPRLRTIWIGSNNIQTFCMPPRRMWPRMTVLGLAQNNISSFYLPPWGGLSVNLRRNPIHCDSAMNWVRRCVAGPESIDTLRCSRDDRIIYLTCYSPESVAGLSPIDTGKDLV